MKRRIAIALVCRRIAIALVCIGSCSAQVFSSGSNGSDGPYTPTVSGDFDPAALGIKATGDNVFNFTNISIPAGVTINLRADKVRNTSVVWLASGNVTIAGNLLLDGQDSQIVNATSFATVVQTRAYPIPGQGGYTGGLGSRDGNGAEPGAGPGGGSVGGGNASHYSLAFPRYATSGLQYGSVYLVPLLGGSGGGGASIPTGFGSGGAAGGGAIRIVSSTQISVTGFLGARGGTGPSLSGGGSGGAIHLIAPNVSGNGTLSVRGGNSPEAGRGWMRFNTNSNTFNSSTDTVTLNNGFYGGPLYNVPPNNIQALPTLTITQINGVNVPASPLGGYQIPDVQINASTPINVDISAANIPIGTVVTLRLQSEIGGDTFFNCNPLAGASAAATTAKCSATYPFSISISSVRATW